MRLRRRCHIVAGVVSIIVSILIGITFVYGLITNVVSATTGTHREYLRKAGTAIARGLRENNAFPRDCRATERKTDNRLSSLINVEQMLSKYGGVNDRDMPKRYFDANIWTVIENIPNDPPPNLIVLATRNVDSSSLRTRLTDEDLQKHIRFKDKKDDLWILNQIAVFVYADGLAFGFKVAASSSKTPNRATYEAVYRGQPFDLTTNAVDGLQVKYLTSDGETTPTND